MYSGIVKWFDDKKGYGFITGDDTGKEYFVHYSGIISEAKFKKLKDGDVNTGDVFKFTIDGPNYDNHEFTLQVAVNVGVVK